MSNNTEQKEALFISSMGYTPSLSNVDLWNDLKEDRRNAKNVAQEVNKCKGIAHRHKLLEKGGPEDYMQITEDEMR